MTIQENHPAIRLSCGVYRVMLRAYPANFRKDYEQEMIWFFTDSCRDAIKISGWRGILGLWLRTLPDWAITTIKEQLLTSGYTGANKMDTTQFNQQFTSTLALFSRALRDGYNVKQCLGLIAKHAPEPTRSLFQKALTDVESGGDILSALGTVSDEIGSPFLQQTIDIMADQRHTGGNLADFLDDYNRGIHPKLGDAGWARTVDLGDGYDPDTHYPLN